MRVPFLIVTSIILISCGGSDAEMPTVENLAPAVPELLVPSEGAFCTDNPLDFEWSAATDPEGDGVQYEIQVATNNTFTEGVQLKRTSITNHTFTLLKNTAYYWRVRAKDNKNNVSEYSAPRTYFTEGEGVVNHLPSFAAIVEPALSTTVIDVATTLEWVASDPDNDPLTYDVYFGNSNPPEILVENSTASTKQVNLDTAGTYYWKIVVKDDKGGKSIGQVWEFIAE